MKKTLQDGENKSIFIESEHKMVYENKNNRLSFENLYDSEKHTLEKVLPLCSSIMDIGCLNGDTLSIIKNKFNVQCSGIDIDVKAIEIAQKRYKDISFFVGDFLDSSFTCQKADLVFAFNLFDHFVDWKAALRNLKRFSNRFINVSSLLRLNGPTLIDPETNFIFYAGGESRLLWAVHNVFEIAAFSATEFMNAVSIYVYCYKKYNQKRFNNVHLSVHNCHTISPQEMLVGNIVIEFDDHNGMKKTKRRPDLKIILDDQVIFDSPWKNNSNS